MQITEKITITNEDNMALMARYPDKYFDLAIIDPPYGLGDIKGTINKGRDKNKYNLFEDTLDNVQKLIIPRVLEAIRVSKVCIVTPGPKALCLYPNPDGFGVFYQPATCSMSKWGRSDSQPILYYGRDPDIGKKIKFCSYKLTEKSQKEAKFHPCPKPLKAWSWLIQKGLGETGVKVLDPFLGSGTTAIICHDYAYELTACELDPDYYDKSIIRIKNHISQLKMF